MNIHPGVMLDASLLGPSRGPWTYAQQTLGAGKAGQKMDKTGTEKWVKNGTKDGQIGGFSGFF